mmetsp:Transcript_35645/g.101585  ORF Transcript_35645/g.101585 Transcript_35645/m.101585 type:complete len:288 (-) Transcript_35645:31-894(-)
MAPERRRLGLCLALLAGAAEAVSVGSAAASAVTRLAGRFRSSAHAVEREVGSLGGSFVRSFGMSHNLRICNAYPYVSTLGVRKGKEDLTGTHPLAYKECADFDAELTVGDRLEFSMGSTGAGTFEITDSPMHEAVLLLVVTRHDTLSTAMSFQSHIFAHVLNAQIAVIDAYRGHRHATPKISSKKGSESEELRFESVVALNQGIYDVELLGSNGESMAKADLVALNRESYIMMRVGVDAQAGPSYKEELVIWPRSSVLSLMSAAPRSCQALGVWAALLSVAAACALH